MNLSNIIYDSVEESFGMGGPYLGYLNFLGTKFKNKFIVDSEKLSEDKSKIVLCKYSNSKKASFFQFTKRHFHIIVYDEKNQAFYQSINSYNGLFIESFIGNRIIFHEAFHNSMKKYQRELVFDENNFQLTSISEL